MKHSGVQVEEDAHHVHRRLLAHRIRFGAADGMSRQGLGFRVYRVWGLGFRVSGLGFRV